MEVFCELNVKEVILYAHFEGWLQEAVSLLTPQATSRF
jgi:hypothetical protein